MEILANLFRGHGLPADTPIAAGDVSTDADAPRDLLAYCPAAAATPLRECPDLADQLGIASLHLKDESARMGLGSFKALGAAYVIAREAARRCGTPDDPARMAAALDGVTYACASAGNHGLSVAAGARLFGARAVIYLADAVPAAFAHRLQRLGAEVVRPGGSYEHSMQAVADAAEDNGWILLSDSSWPGYIDLPRGVMEGYLVMGAEVVEALATPPTHIFLQAGVGGLAAAMTVLFRLHWGDAPTIIVVEPEAAPALIESIRAGAPIETAGPASNMGRLDCKAPSHLALAALARGADLFVTLSDGDAADAADALTGYGIGTTPSGAAGFAALRDPEAHAAFGLASDSRVLAFISEGREDDG